jgi:hypothetical protein
VRYEHILSEAKEARAINRPPNDVLDSQTMREMNQALQEVSEHQRELKPLVPPYVVDKAVMEKRKPVWKGA